jgi:pyruvate/2-oxoglutarate dehydrogenase complex dihydrolipoamide acyltransferase (E2) component
MMEETNRTFMDDEGEETMVSPRFDDEETVLARPVVPFEEVSDAPPATSASAPPPPLYSRLRAAPRRSLVAALVLISVLVGSALGVAGLYFYQKHGGGDAPTATEQQQQADVPAPAAAAAQATPEPAPESQARETNAHAAEPPAPAPASTERDARAEGDALSSKGSGREEAVAAPVVERRNISEGRDAVVNPKHGKKGERDEEQRREARRENRDNADDQPVRADDGDGNGREARRVGVITYRPRRARMRRDNYGNADRLRRIFEGQP